MVPIHVTVFFISLLMMKSGYLDIGELVHILSDQGRQNIVTALDVAMPAPSFFDRYTVDVLFDQI